MAFGTTQITIKHPNDSITLDTTTVGGRERTLRRLENYLGSLVIRAKGSGGSVDVQQEANTTVLAVGRIGSDAVAASGTVTISSGSGTITATINGVAITATWTTSDTHTGDLLVAAIAASSNALVKGVVTSSNAAGVVTISAAVKGVMGNCVTLAASGTGATASGGRLTGGVDATAKTLSF